MKTRTAILLVFAFSLLSFAAGWLAYPALPDQIASHWNAAGEADGFASKTSALTLIPILSLVTGAILILLPRLDPLRENLKEFRGLYLAFVVVMGGFFFYLQVITLLVNLGWQANLVMLLIPAYAIIFYFSGLLVGKARRNWFIGVRTPWTLSSDFVWEKTHQLGGRLFKWSAVVCLIGLLIPEMAIYFMVVPALLTAAILMVYSYLIYRKIGG